MLDLGTYHTARQLLKHHWTAHYTLVDLMCASRTLLHQQVHHIPSPLTIFTFNHSTTLLLLLLLISLVARGTIALGTFSGHNNIGIWGDYECQRHWMSVTTNNPSNEWYHSTYKINRTHWPLDYPPLSAHHSYLCGRVSQWLWPSSMTPLTSIGYYTPQHKLFMRLTSIVTDMLLYVTGGWLVTRQLVPQHHPHVHLILFGLVSLMPTLLLIDHGHFQYNSAMLGLCLLSFNHWLNKHLGWCCMCLALAVNFKVTTLFYSLAMAVGVVSRVFRHRVWQLVLIKLVVGVCLVFCITWYPVVAKWEDIGVVLRAIFPVHRGLYQLQVATFWFCSERVFKWAGVLSLGQCALMAVVGILLLSSPSLLLLYKRPKRKVFCLSLLSTSLAFYFLSIHVHEKTVMVPALSALLSYKYLAHLAIDFQLFAYFTLFQLMIEDGLTNQYLLYGIFYFFFAYVIL